MFHEADMFYLAQRADGIWCEDLTPEQLALGATVGVYAGAIMHHASLEPSGPLDPLNLVPRWLPFGSQSNPEPVMHWTAAGEGKGPLGVITYESITDSDGGNYAYHTRCDLLDKLLAKQYNIPALDPSTYVPPTQHH